MDRTTELALMDELRALKATKTHFLDEAVATNVMDSYTSAARFESERDRVFRHYPVAAAHVSDMPAPGDFVRTDVVGQPVLLTRDKAGKAHAFLNVCRHRGAQLVSEERGCKKHRFTCPYHAWTYASSGELLAAPHFEEGFPGLEKSELGLAELPCEEKWGFIWVTPNGARDQSIEAYLGDLAADFDALRFDDMQIVARDTSVRKANWKILVEGGIEAYHFKVTHRTTIGPHFEDNLSSYQCFGDHMRSILPRTSMATLDGATRQTWDMRDHANILYTLFPWSQFLVLQDHIVWIRSNPLSADETQLYLCTLAPNATAEDKEHWQRNHEITMTTLNEDFEIGEGIQVGARSGANADVRFGRFEGALAAFNQAVDRHILDEPS